MSERHLTVDVKQDHLERLASCRPVHAVSELIWNSVDADANVVDVQIQYNELGMESITVTDNGHGIKYQNVDTLFESIGG